MHANYIIELRNVINSKSLAPNWSSSVIHQIPLETKRGILDAYQRHYFLILAAQLKERHLLFMASFVFHWGLLQRAREPAFILLGFLPMLQKERSRSAGRERKRLDPQSPFLMMLDRERVFIYYSVFSLHFELKKRPK